MRNLIVLSALFLFWYYVGGNTTINFFISDPISVYEYIQEQHIELLKAFFITFSEAFFGLSLAVILSYVFGVICVYVPSLLVPVRATFVVTQVLPIITLAPLFIAVMGMGVLSKIVMVTIMCFFPIFMSLIEGIHRVKIYADDFLDLYQANNTYKIFNLYIPLSLPSVFVGIKVAATLAVLGAVVAEFLGAYTGLGKNLYRAPKLANAELMMASAMLTAIMGMIIFKVVDILQRTLTKWDGP